MLLERLGKELLFFDGGMGTSLQAEGLQSGELPETWNIEKKEIIRKVHQLYFEAGSDIVLTNTFGANALKFHSEKYSLKEIVDAAVENVRFGAKAGIKDDREYFVALDIGPTGKLLKPMGELDFEDAYGTFQEVVQYGEAAGVDLIHIETMSDTYEVKAAVLAAKENTKLPVFATMVFDANGKLLTGGDIPSVVAMLEGLHVDALGVNCGMGPEQMVSVVKEIAKYTSLPIIAKPNAGLPKQKNGENYYDFVPELFADYQQEIVKSGACVIGGCCGTTPNHIRAMVAVCKELEITKPSCKPHTIVSSYGKAVELGNGQVVISECINPTGKGELEDILDEAFEQQDKGVQILAVNVGAEGASVQEVIQELQSVIKLPLLIKADDITAMEQAMRVYNGKPMVSIVNDTQESLDAMSHLVQKYGGVVFE